MADPQIRILLAAVRRRLWRAQFVAALRQAIWGSAGLMLLAAALGWGDPIRVPAGALAGSFGLVWGALLARAGWRRPCTAACALWADRHLGGASAFSTLQDLGWGPPGTVDRDALQALEAWAAERVPQSLLGLAGRAEPTRLARPLLALVACAALAALVRTLPELAAPSSQPAAVAAASADAARPLAQADEATTLASEIGRALRSAAPPQASPGRAGEAGTAGAPTPGDAGAPTAAPGAVSAAPQAAGPQAAGVPTPDPAPAVSAPNPNAIDGGTGGGREAGASRDGRADVGVSRPLRGTMAVQRSVLPPGRAPPALQADFERAATYDDDAAARSAVAARTDAAVAAATPPAAAESARLSPTEASYVQAWMKASTRQR